MMTRSMILALSLTLGSLPAAATENDVATTNVRIGDLDLSQAADRERLAARLKWAANRVCNTGVRGSLEMTPRPQCVAAALANAAPQAEQAIAQAKDGKQLALLTIRTAR